MTSYDDDRPIDEDAETIIRRVIDHIATARTIPLSSSPMINRDEIIEWLEEALGRFPDDLRQARWLLKERDDFLAKTKREADDILEAASNQATRMVQRTEVVRASEQRAQKIVDAADAASRKLRMETEDFIDQRLASFQIVLDRVHKTVAAGRERLNGSVAMATGSVPVTRNPTTELEQQEDDAANAFFDQDLT
jgi:ParB-like chromosome segregation protein Spo0J